MKDSIKNKVRALFSLAAFTTLVAAFTLSYADKPTRKRNVHIDKQAKRKTLPTNSAPVYLAKAASTQKNVEANQSQSAAGTVNLNTATASDLEKLPGIGPKKAATILAWRAKHGKFRRIVDLRRVKGIGAKTLKKLRPYLSLSGTTTL